MSNCRVNRAKSKLKKAEGRCALGAQIHTGPIAMIYDPQNFAERLFSKLRASKEVCIVKAVRSSDFVIIAGVHHSPTANECYLAARV